MTEYDAHHGEVAWGRAAVLVGALAVTAGILVVGAAATVAAWLLTRGRR